jgi:hypothetical protein
LIAGASRFPTSINLRIMARFFDIVEMAEFPRELRWLLKTSR